MNKTAFVLTWLAFMVHTSIGLFTVVPPVSASSAQVVACPVPDSTVAYVVQLFLSDRFDSVREQTGTHNLSEGDVVAMTDSSDASTCQFLENDHDLSDYDRNLYSRYYFKGGGFYFVFDASRPSSDPAVFTHRFSAISVLDSTFSVLGVYRF